MKQAVLGIDGGGTKTLATICDLHGSVLGSGQAGASNIDDVGLEIATQNITLAVSKARAEANFAPEPFAAAFLGLAGVVSHQDRQMVLGLARSLELAPIIEVDHDCRIALAGGLTGREGIVLIVGTGSSCYGRNSIGQTWRAGGWGSLISDEGSGYDIGRQSLIAAVRGIDGRGAKTGLTDLMLRLLGITDPDQILHRLYVTGLSRAEISALAPPVLALAEQGDRIALEILQRGWHQLAECVLAVAKKLELEQSEVVLVGGISSSWARTYIQTAILKSLANCKITQPEMSPVLGACLLARRLLELN
jgi:glucosamine kinase